MKLSSALRRLVLGVGLPLLLCANASAQYPDRPVTIVTPYAPGGLTDVLARDLAAHLQTALGKPFIVENKPGAGGVIGTSYVMRAPPDGYTILLTSTSNQLMLPEAMKKKPYDGAADFTPIGLILQYPFLLVGRPGGPATVQALVEKGRKSELTWGSFGVGGGNHLVGSYFMQSQGLKGVHVPYKGTAASTMALISGDLDFVFDSYLATSGQIKAGKLIPIAVSTRERMEVLPSVPTLQESGLKSFDEAIWQGIVGPKGMPPDVVKVLNQEINKFVADPQRRQRNEAQGATMLGGSSEDYRKALVNDSERWKRFIADHDIKIED